MGYSQYGLELCPQMTVRTRFAPSPTGYLHIGGVRMALFNWLFARRHGGQFILRIDDTDQQRNVEEALAPILHGLHWLGIDWDEGPEVGGPYAPYYQSQRRRPLPGGGREAAGRRAWPTRLRHDRGIAGRARGGRAREAALSLQPPLDGRDRRPTGQFEAEGRMRWSGSRCPARGAVIHDLVRGDVALDWAREQDHVVQRADGTCLYHLANVVDDHDFEITHVIRAEEHLSNTPRQVFIAQRSATRCRLRPFALRGRAGQQDQAQQAQARQVSQEPRLRRCRSTAGDRRRR